MSKSALKKTSMRRNDETQERRRVTFCKSVKVFAYPCVPSSAGEEDSGSTEDDEDQESDHNIDEDSKDFLVHKVIYNDYDESSGNLQSDPVESDTIVYYPYEAESELQEFVVHCVNLLEDRKDVKLPNSDESKNCDTVISRGLGELSVENIEQHNKLTDSKMRLEAAIVESPISSGDIVLSPPLQELSIDRLIETQSEEWFQNLDISPLNSVQESDSDSNISSEDTMIMMTTAECEKNEQHIQESLQKFELLKRDKLNNDSDTKTVTENQKWYSQDNLQNEPVESFLLESTSCDESEISLDSSGELLMENNSINDHISSEMSFVHNVSEYENRENAGVSENARVIIERPSTTTIDDKSVTFENSSTVVDIPEDVREWKIIAREKPSGCDAGHGERASIASSYSAECDTLDSLSLTERTCVSLPDNNLDELESFVDQCTERVERIRKRYSLNENSKYIPRRGIRPRFGSTAQILQQMQSERHSALSNHHYSWPYYTSVNAEPKDSSLSSSRTDLLERSLGGLTSDRLMNPGSYSFDDHREETLQSDQEAPLTVQERGDPEGSSPSPPRLSLESLLETRNETDSSSDNVIYYSMKV